MTDISNISAFANVSYPSDEKARIDTEIEQEQLASDSRLPAEGIDRSFHLDNRSGARDEGGQIFYLLEVAENQPMDFVSDPSKLEKTFYYTRLQNFTIDEAIAIKSEIEILLAAEPNLFLYEIDLLQIRRIVDILDAFIKNDKSESDERYQLMCVEKIYDLADAVGNRDHLDNTFVNAIYFRYIVPVLQPKEDSNLDIEHLQPLWRFLTDVLNGIDTFEISQTTMTDFSRSVELAIAGALSESRYLDHATVQILDRILASLIAAVPSAGCSAKAAKMEYVLRYLQAFLCDSYNYNNEFDRVRHSQYNPNLKFYNAPVHLEHVFSPKTLHLIVSRGEIENATQDDLLVLAPEISQVLSCLVAVFEDPSSEYSETLLQNLLKSNAAIKIILSAMPMFESCVQSAALKQNQSVFDFSGKELHERFVLLQTRLQMRMDEIAVESILQEWRQIWKDDSLPSGESIIETGIFSETGFNSPQGHKSDTVFDDLRRSQRKIISENNESISVWHNEFRESLVNDVSSALILSSSLTADDYEILGYEVSDECLHELILLSTIELMYGSEMQQVMARDLNCFLFGDPRGGVLLRELPELVSDEGNHFSKTSAVSAVSVENINETRVMVRTISGLAACLLKQNAVGPVEQAQLERIYEAFVHVDHLMVMKYHRTVR